MGEQFEAPLFPDKPLQFTASSRRSLNAELRLRGQAYYGIVQDGDMSVKYSQNKPMPARKLRAPCISPTCATSKKRACAEISESERRCLFANFWNLGSWKEKREFIAGLIEAEETKHKTTLKPVSRRLLSFRYFLPVEGVRKQVCQNMFLNTFDLNSAKVRGWKMKIG